MFKRFIPYYKPHKKLFFLDMTAALVASLIGVVYPIITRTMLNDLIPQKEYKMIIFAGVALLVLYYIRKRLDCFVQYKGHVMGRSDCGRTVHFEADDDCIGRIVPVVVTQVTGNTLCAARIEEK